MLESNFYECFVFSIESKYAIVLLIIILYFTQKKNISYGFLKIGKNFNLIS